MKLFMESWLFYFKSEAVPKSPVVFALSSHYHVFSMLDPHCLEAEKTGHNWCSMQKLLISVHTVAAEMKWCWGDNSWLDTARNETVRREGKTAYYKIKLRKKSNMANKGSAKRRDEKPQEILKRREPPSLFLINFNNIFLFHAQLFWGLVIWNSLSFKKKP